MVEMAKLEIHKGVDAEVDLGGLRFRACRREVGEIDGGVTLQVLQPDEAGETELVRFDCFRKSPHYHAPAENKKETKIASSESSEWVFERVSQDPVALLEEAGFRSLAEGLDLAALADAAPRLRTLVASLAEPSETSFFEIEASVLEGLAKG